MELLLITSSNIKPKVPSLNMWLWMVQKQVLLYTALRSLPSTLSGFEPIPGLAGDRLPTRKLSRPLKMVSSDFIPSSHCLTSNANRAIFKTSEHFTILILFSIYPVYAVSGFLWLSSKFEQIVKCIPGIWILDSIFWIPDYYFHLLLKLISELLILGSLVWTFHLLTFFINQLKANSCCLQSSL